MTVLDQSLLWVWAASVLLIFVSGCQFPAKRPIWFADSSGVVVGNQSFDLAAKQTHSLIWPAPGPDFRQDIYVDPQSRRVTYAWIKWDKDRSTTAELLIATAPSPGKPPSEPIPFTLTFPPEFERHSRFSSPDAGGLEIHPAPKGTQVLVGTGMYTSIVDLATRKVITLPEITPPLRFSRVFGISPCRPDGSGFLALRKRLSSDEPAQVKPDPQKSYVTRLRRTHNAFVIVSWDGTITPLDGRDALPEDIPMLEIFYYDAQFPTVVGFPGTTAWQDGVVVLKFLDARLELDFVAHAVRYTVGPVETQEALRDRYLQELTSERMVDLNDGGCVVRTRLHRKNDKNLANFKFRMELTVQQRLEPTERIIDVSEPGFVFELFPSPDRTALVCVSRSPMGADTWEPNSEIAGVYSVLLDRGGEYVTSFGISEKNWRWRSADQTIGLPEAVKHERFGAGYALAEAHCTARTIEFMLSGEGQFAPLRQTRFLDLKLTGHSSPILPTGLSGLAAFPKLKSVRLSAEASEYAMNLDELPRVTGLSAVLTDEHLARMPTLNPITTLELQRPTPKTVVRNNRVEKDEFLTAAGLRNLSKFPRVADLTIAAPINPVEQPCVALPGLSELRTLAIICDERIAVLEHLENLPSLRSFSLQGGTITGPALEVLNAAVSLESLTVRGSSLELPETPVFAGLIALKRLDLSVGDGVNQRLLESIGALQGLESLRLNGRAAESLNLESLKRLTALRHLEIALSQIPKDARRVVYSHLSVVPLKELTSLESLTLRLIDIDPRDLAELRSLTRLKQAHLGQATDPHEALRQLSSAIPAARLSIYYPTQDSVLTAVFKGGQPVVVR